MGEAGCGGDVRGEVGVGKTEQGVVRPEGFGVVDIEQCGRAFVGAEEDGEGGGIDHRAATGVDDDDGRLESRGDIGVEEMAVRGAGIDVDGEDIGPGEEFVAQDGLGTVALRLGDLAQIVVEDVRTEAGGDSGDALADSSETPKAEGDFAQLTRGVELAPQVVPALGVDPAIEEDAGAHGVEQQGEDVLGDGGAVGIGCVNDLDATTATFADIDAVEPDTCPRDDAEARGAVEQILADAGVSPDDQSVGVLKLFGEARFVGEVADAQLAAFHQPRGGVRIEIFALQHDGVIRAGDRRRIAHGALLPLR